MAYGRVRIVKMESKNENISEICREILTIAKEYHDDRNIDAIDINRLMGQLLRLSAYSVVLSTLMSKNIAEYNRIYAQRKATQAEVYCRIYEQTPPPRPKSGIDKTKN